MEPQMDTDAHGSEGRGDGRPPSLNELTDRIIGCAYKVLNSLGCGFLEKVYENALLHELRKTGLFVQQQHPVPIYYDGVLVGDYTADLIVEETVLLELKAVQALDEIHEAQCLNYLKATGLPICLLLNFGRPRLGLRRLAGAAHRENVA